MAERCNFPLREIQKKSFLFFSRTRTTHSCFGTKVVSGACAYEYQWREYENEESASSALNFRKVGFRFLQSKSNLVPSSIILPLFLNLDLFLRTYTRAKPLIIVSFGREFDCRIKNEKRKQNRWNQKKGEIMILY